MSHNTRARLFVEKFLQDAGAEAADLFKCDLENAIEELLEEVEEEALEVARAEQTPLVWLKPKGVTASVLTLRGQPDEFSAEFTKEHVRAEA
jgi:hypothetical protein